MRARGGRALFSAARFSTRTSFFRMMSFLISGGSRLCFLALRLSDQYIFETASLRLDMYSARLLGGQRRRTSSALAVRQGGPALLLAAAYAGDLDVDRVDRERVVGWAISPLGTACDRQSSRRCAAVDQRRCLAATLLADRRTRKGSLGWYRNGG